MTPQTIGTRTVEDLRESTLFGKLYRIVSEHGDKLIVHRVRRRGKDLYLMRMRKRQSEERQGPACLRGLGTLCSKIVISVGLCGKVK